MKPQAQTKPRMILMSDPIQTLLACRQTCRVMLCDGSPIQRHRATSPPRRQSAFSAFRGSANKLLLMTCCVQVNLPGNALQRVINAAPQGDITIAPGFALPSLALVAGLGSGGFIVPDVLTGTLSLQNAG